MSSTSRRFLLRHPIVVDTGCSCRLSKLSSFISCSSSQKQRTPNATIFSTPSETTTTSQSFDDSPSSASSPMKLPARAPTEKKQGMEKKGAVEESVAVVKDSLNPYIDFRDSMMQMIMEKEMYAWDDLCELLHRFLSLNSPYHHHHIIRAFSEICNRFFCPAAAAGGGVGGPALNQSEQLSRKVNGRARMHQNTGLKQSIGAVNATCHLSK